MDKTRLLKLADLLEADAANPKGVKFDLSEWGTSQTKRAKIGCGTTACAVGLACISGAFKEDGLGFDIDKTDPAVYEICPRFAGSYGFYAIEGFFDIDDLTARRLFSMHSYEQKEQKGQEGERAVAKRIREFVAR